jgi:hypothetical protein
VGITPNVVVPVTDDEDRDLQLKRTPGGMETLDETNRIRILNERDLQLDRATDLLKGILLFTERSHGPTGAPDGKMASIQDPVK